MTTGSDTASRPAPRSARMVPHRRHTQAWIFDLDNTLYPAHCNLFAQVEQRIGEFVATALGLGPKEARALQKKYFREHGTTLSGLMRHHSIEPAAYLEYVHDIDMSGVAEIPELDDALSALDGRKLIYTNGSAHHAENVLRQLGVRHHFEAIYDIVAADYRPKPDAAPYEYLVLRHDIDPLHAVMIEDIARNLVPAAALGMATVWLRTHLDWSREGSEGDHVHYITDDLVAWLAALPREDMT